MRIPGRFALLASACAVAGLGAACSQASDTDDHDDAAGWQLVWADEFDGDALDDSRWNREHDCWGGGNEERQCYLPREENARVEDGRLIIEAHFEEATGPALPERLWQTEDDRTATNTQPFTSGRINTSGKGDWTYGRIEVRARLPEGQGTWPAIWMLPTDNVYGGWALSGEIDILEAVNLGAVCLECEEGVENRMFGTLHFGGAWPHNQYQNRRRTLPVGEDGEKIWHEFAIEWSEGRVEWFLDGESYGYLTPEHWNTQSNVPEAQGNPNAPFDQRFHLILNLAIGGHLAESHTAGGVDMTGYPKQFEVDYVRVYECAGDPTAVACRHDADDA